MTVEIQGSINVASFVCGVIMGMGLLAAIRCVIWMVVHLD